MNIEGAASGFGHLVKLKLNLTSLSFVIRVNLLHRGPSLLFYGLLLGTFRLDYEYENEYENNFSVLVCRLHIIMTQTHIIP